MDLLQDSVGISQERENNYQEIAGQARNDNIV